MPQLASSQPALSQPALPQHQIPQHVMPQHAMPQHALAQLALPQALQQYHDRQPPHDEQRLKPQPQPYQVQGLLDRPLDPVSLAALLAPKPVALRGGMGDSTPPSMITTADVLRTALMLRLRLGLNAPQQQFPDMFRGGVASGPPALPHTPEASVRGDVSRGPAPDTAMTERLLSQVRSTEWKSNYMILLLFLHNSGSVPPGSVAHTWLEMQRNLVAVGALAPAETQLLRLAGVLANITR
jgi:hypothetical protein